MKYLSSLILMCLCLLVSAQNDIIIDQVNDSIAILLEANEGTTGAAMKLYDSTGVNTIELDAQGVSVGSHINLSDPDGNLRYQIAATRVDGTRGSRMLLYNTDNIASINLNSQEGETNGSSLHMTNWDGYTSIELDAENGDDGPGSLILYNGQSNNQGNPIRGVQIDGKEGDGGGQINLYTSTGLSTAQLDAEGGSGQAFLELKDPNGNRAVLLNGSNNSGSTFYHKLTIQGSDFAERFNVNSSKVLPGMLVSIDPDQAGELIVTSTHYDTRAVGVVSGAGGVEPGMVMGEEGTLADGDTPVALSGRVYVYADASKQAIAVGDLLTSSNTPGHVMKVKKRKKAIGAVIGKALTPLRKGEKGLVLMVLKSN